MSDNVWSLLSALPWPVAIGGVAYCFRSQLADLAEAFVTKFKAATKIKIAGIELEGEYFAPKGAPDVSAVSALDGNSRLEIPANKSDSERRNEIYNGSRHLMLAHKIAPSKLRGQKYDLSVFLIRKTRSGVESATFDDVKQVSYYLGSYFGSGEQGAKFVVSNPNNGFAMKTSAYGQALCVAEIEFKDGVVTRQYRFLDFAMGEVFEE